MDNTPPPPSPLAQPTQDPGKTLGIIGFILSFFLSFIGMILSIIAFAKSKKAGHMNGLALAGIILGALFTIFWVLIISAIVITAYNGISQKAQDAAEAARLCESTNRSSVRVGDEVRICNNGNSPSPREPRSSTDSPTDIAKSPVTLDGSTVNAACFSFTLPSEYIMSPKSETCQTELRLKSDGPSGVALTAIFVKGQIGNTNIDDFFRKYKAAGGDKVSDEKRLTINGYSAAALTLTNSMGIKQTVYFIVDDSGKFKASNGTITSYLIYGPATIKEPLDTILQSFRIK